MREISKYMGVPYVHGGAGTDGMDCSGYTMTVYKNAIGKTLPRSSMEQSKLGKKIELNGLKFGDLIFFNTTGRKRIPRWNLFRRRSLRSCKRLVRRDDFFLTKFLLCKTV